MDSILPGGNERECYWCRNPFNLEKHHVFHGTANRKLADEDGCWVYLCREHHTGNSGVHKHKWLDMDLKMKAQTAWEQKYGTREEFIKRYGRNYL